MSLSLFVFCCNVFQEELLNYLEVERNFSLENYIKWTLCLALLEVGKSELFLVSCVILAIDLQLSQRMPRQLDRFWFSSKIRTRFAHTSSANFSVLIQFVDS